MSLSATLDQIKDTLPRSRAERLYSDARTRLEVLAPFESIGALIAACERGSGLSPEKRDELFAAMVTELQRSPSPLWQSLLLVVFTPMLVRLRARLGPPRDNDPNSEDLDRTVLLAFLETARALTFRTYVARNLWLLTRARLHAERSRERRAPKLLVFDDETQPCDPFRAETQQRAAAAEILRVIEAEGGEELRDLLLTCTDDESVQEYVDHAYAHCDGRARARASKRLRRARLEVFAKLRVRAEKLERALAPAA
jgi:hypothetical protein